MKEFAYELSSPVIDLYIQRMICAQAMKKKKNIFISKNRLKLFNNTHVFEPNILLNMWVLLNSFNPGF